MSKASRYFKGMPREYLQAVALGVIDKRVRELVAAFNVPGVVLTHASCQGHCGLTGRVWQPAFVVFQTSTGLAFQLVKRIRADLLSTRRRLNYYWSIEANFQEDGDTDELFFYLHCRADHFRRVRLDADFVTLAQWVGEIFAQAKNPLTGSTLRLADRNGNRDAP